MQLCAQAIGCTCDRNIASSSLVQTTYNIHSLAQSAFATVFVWLSILLGIIVDFVLFVWFLVSVKEARVAALL